VREVGVYLLDEPLSNLDAKLRSELRRELKLLHHALGATMVYVTHDQAEAMTLGSRIAIMRHGVIVQAGPPMELYRRPANQFVAGFVGSPAMNFLSADLVPSVGTPSLSRARLGIRPHDITIVAPGAGDQDAWVDVVEPRGSEQLVYLRLGGDHAGPELRVIAPPETRVEAEQTVGVRFDREKLHWFDPESGRRLSSD
jgi:multiple sugar transport system ATP-binding protein